MALLSGEAQVIWGTGKKIPIFFLKKFVCTFASCLKKDYGLFFKDDEKGDWGDDSISKVLMPASKAWGLCSDPQ